MRIYIAYKYKLISDKDRLIANLALISQYVEAKGYIPFILGRDVHRWNCSSTPVWKTVPLIFWNILKSSKVLVYVDSEVKSFGLATEIACSILLRKKIYLLINKGLKENLLRSLATQVVEFENLSDSFTSLNV
jgi:hypothetical protein